MEYVQFGVGGSDVQGTSRHGYKHTVSYYSRDTKLTRVSLSLASQSDRPLCTE